MDSSKGGHWGDYSEITLDKLIKHSSIRDFGIIRKLFEDLEENDSEFTTLDSLIQISPEYQRMTIWAFYNYITHMNKYNMREVRVGDNESIWESMRKMSQGKDIRRVVVALVMMMEFLEYDYTHKFLMFVAIEGIIIPYSELMIIGSHVYNHSLGNRSLIQTYFLSEIPNEIPNVAETMKCLFHGNSDRLFEKFTEAIDNHNEYTGLYIGNILIIRRIFPNDHIFEIKSKEVSFINLLPKYVTHIHHGGQRDTFPDIPPPVSDDNNPINQAYERSYRGNTRCRAMVALCLSPSFYLPHILSVPCDRDIIPLDIICDVIGASSYVDEILVSYIADNLMASDERILIAYASKLTGYTGAKCTYMSTRTLNRLYHSCFPINIMYIPTGYINQEVFKNGACGVSRDNTLNMHAFKKILRIICSHFNNIDIHFFKTIYDEVPDDNTMIVPNNVNITPADMSFLLAFGLRVIRPNGNDVYPGQ